MAKNVLLYLILISVSIFNISSLNKNDFCYSKDIKCKTTDKSSCNYVCDDKYEYKCVNKFCTLNNETCSEFKNFSKMNSFITMFEFKNNLKPCKIKPIRLSKNDFCLNSLDCIRDELTWMRKFLIKPEKIIGCLCKGKYLFKCDKNFCSTNNRVCGAIKQAKQENIRAQAIDIGVKECQN